MKRVMTVIGRFFVRLWHAHRNQIIEQAHKILVKALHKRLEVLSQVPESYRDTIINNDPVLKRAKLIAQSINAVFTELGVTYEK